MTASFIEMKKSRGQSTLDRVQQEVAKLNSGGFQQDQRYWQPVVGKDGNGSAIIRFLPAPKGEEVPFVRLWSYAWKNRQNGKWYIENSPTTLGRPDPMAEYNSELWNSGEAGQAHIRRQQMQRKLGFISNIKVIKHPAKPEDEGKIFLHKYGVKIFNKLNDRMNPPEELGIPPMNPFDFWDGANFSLQIYTEKNKDGSKGFRNYDKSMFLPQGPLSDNDDELEAIWNNEYPLQPEIGEDKFKTYDELQKKLYVVLGKAVDKSADPSAPQHEDTQRAAEPATTTAEAGKFPPWNVSVAASSSGGPDEAAPAEADNEAMAFFKRLANG